MHRWPVNTARDGVAADSNFLTDRQYAFTFVVSPDVMQQGVLWALAIGYTLWGDVPNLLAISGIAVVVGAGLYILHRERVTRLRALGR